MITRLREWAELASVPCTLAYGSSGQHANRLQDLRAANQRSQALTDKLQHHAHPQRRRASVALRPHEQPSLLRQRDVPMGQHLTNSIR